MLDHNPNRTTNIRLLDILRGHLRGVVCRDARRWLVVDNIVKPHIPLVFLVARIGTFPTVFATRKPKGGVKDRRD
jgi:hypothetical protein